jgi:hypothetical protein
MKKTRLFSLQLTDDEREMFKAVAEHKGQTMSGALRVWIRKAFAALPKRTSPPTGE